MWWAIPVSHCVWTFFWKIHFKTLINCRNTGGGYLARTGLNFLQEEAKHTCSSYTQSLVNTVVKHTCKALKTYKFVWVQVWDVVCGHVHGNQGQSGFIFTGKGEVTPTYSKCTLLVAWERLSARFGWVGWKKHTESLSFPPIPPYPHTKTHNRESGYQWEF